MLFTYDPAITDRFPAIRAAIIHATGLANGPSSPELTVAYLTEQQAVIERLRQTPIAELPSIGAWRRIFTAFGAKPTQYRNAAESLLRRLDKQGDIPTLGTLVDIGNLVAIRHALPVAVLDLDRIAPPITVRFATGDERFGDLGSSESVTPEPGEVIFIDSAGDVHARRWCWRQSATSATRPETTNALFTVEGHHDAAEADVAAAVADLETLLGRFQPGAEPTTFTLSPEHPAA